MKTIKHQFPLPAPAIVDLQAVISKMKNQYAFYFEKVVNETNRLFDRNRKTMERKKNNMSALKKSFREKSEKEYHPGSFYTANSFVGKDMGASIQVMECLPPKQKTDSNRGTGVLNLEGESSPETDLKSLQPCAKNLSFIQSQSGEPNMSSISKSMLVGTGLQRFTSTDAKRGINSFLPPHRSSLKVVSPRNFSNVSRIRMIGQVNIIKEVEDEFTTSPYPVLNEFRLYHPEIKIYFFLLAEHEDESNMVRGLSLLKHLNSIPKVNGSPSPKQNFINLISKKLEPIQPSPMSKDSEVLVMNTLNSDQIIENSFDTETGLQNHSNSNTSVPDTFEISDSPVAAYNAALDQKAMNYPDQATFPSINLEFAETPIDSPKPNMQMFKGAGVNSEYPASPKLQSYLCQQLKPSLEDKDFMSHKASLDTITDMRSDVDSVLSHINSKDVVKKIEETMITPSVSSSMNFNWKITKADNKGPVAYPTAAVKCPLPLSFTKLEFKGCEHILAKTKFPPPGLSWLFSEISQRKDIKRPGSIVSCLSVDLAEGRLMKSKLSTRYSPQPIQFREGPIKRPTQSKDHLKPKLRDVHFAHIGYNLYLAAVSDYRKHKIPYASDLKSLVESLHQQLY